MALFKKLKSTLQLVQNFDMDKIAKLSQKVDINKMVGLVSSMKEEDLQKLMKFMEGGKTQT
jgi:glutaryl-CoA dehydrogenase